MATQDEIDKWLESATVAPKDKQLDNTQIDTKEARMLIEKSTEIIPYFNRVEANTYSIWLMKILNNMQTRMKKEEADEKN